MTLWQLFNRAFELDHQYHIRSINRMAQFELRSSSCDGHIKALSRAIQVASRFCKEGLLEFTPDKLRLCAKSDVFLVKFVFLKDFFTDYVCDTRHRCYVNLKALLMPFKSAVLNQDKETVFRSTVSMRCNVEDQLNNRLVFSIGGEPTSATLTYKIAINDLDPERMSELNAINRTIDLRQVRMAPTQQKREKFLLSAFNSFAPDIDQVTIRTSASEVKFIGHVSPFTSSFGKKFATSEFSHKREDFSIFEVKEDLSITIPLRYLKFFLTFVETNKIQTCPEYTFEGMGLPAHFDYRANLFRGHFVSATPVESILHEIEFQQMIPIANGPHDESFIADDNVIEPEDANELEHESCSQYIDDEDLDEEDGYNDNQSELSDQLLDANLDALSFAQNGNDLTSYNPSHRYTSNAGRSSVYGAESIRSELLSSHTYDPEKVNKFINLDEDPEEIENAKIVYSDSSDDELD